MQKTKTGIRRAFVDIEVSPNIGLFWAPGYKISINHEAIVKERAIMCVCWSWEGESEVHSLEWDKNQDDKKLLIKLSEILEEADEVAAHFGNGFDIPWIRTRVLFHGLPPMPLFKVVDTKAWASKFFFFNSNKLDYISKFCGSTGKIKTEWSWWRDILLLNCRKTLAKMVFYCKKDVVELKFVWKKLQPHCDQLVHAGVVAGNEKWSCPRTGTTHVKISKRRVTATGQVRWQMQNLDDGSFYSITQRDYENYKQHRLQKVRVAPAKGHSNRRSN